MRTKPRRSLTRDAILKPPPGVEVKVGARARRERRRRLLIASLGVCLIVGSVWFWIAWRSVGSLGDFADYPVAGVCNSCGHEAEADIPVDTVFPSACPACGARDFIPKWDCRSCAAVFIPDTFQTDDLTCPRCGSVSVGTAARPPNAP